MLGRNWRYFITIGLAVLFAVIAGRIIYNEASGLQAFYEHQADKNAQAYHDTAREHAERACASVVATERFKCVHEQYHEARQREREEYDLQAQLVTSAWTRAMGLSAIVAMIVGIVGVGLVYTTFSETREANEISRKEAERNANEAAAARNHVIQSERAILKITDIHVIFREKWIELSLGVKNGGRSNARGLQIFTGERKSRLFPSKLVGHSPSPLIVNAGNRSRTDVVRLKPPRDYPYWIFGYLHYTTAHEATFKSFFAVRLDGVPQDDGYGGMLNPPVDVRDQVELPSDT